MDEMRKAFEAWARGCGWDIDKMGPSEEWGGTYISAAVRFMWGAWQAACAVEREACAAICESERDEAQKQAAAYRFIRAGGAYIEPNEDGTAYVATSKGQHGKTPEEFDAAVFAAMENDNG